MFRYSFRNGNFRNKFSTRKLQVEICLKSPNMIRYRFAYVPKMSIELHPRKYLPQSPGFMELQASVGGFILDTFEAFELPRVLPDRNLEFVGGMHIEKKKRGTISKVI